MSIDYDHVTRTTKFSGIDRVKYNLLVVLLVVGMAAFFVGIYFLDHYRWGGCP